MKNAKIGIVLQARLDSSRLPRKSLLPLDGKPLILRVMEALNAVSADVRALACPEDSVAAFQPLAAAAGFALFAGPKDDVLKRYCLVAREFGISHVIRATGDNPFVFADAANDIKTQAIAVGADYAGYAGLPLGGGGEIVSADALFRAEKDAQSPFEREHVCPYLYNHPEFFLLHRPLSPCEWQGRHARITVDTQEDYERAQALYGALSKAEQEAQVSGNWRYTGAAIIKTRARVFGKAGAGESA